MKYKGYASRVGVAHVESGNAEGAEMAEDAELFFAVSAVSAASALPVLRETNSFN